jgi:hypothetical protein
VYGIGLNIMANHTSSPSLNCIPVVQDGFNGIGYHFDFPHLTISATAEPYLITFMLFGVATTSGDGGDLDNFSRASGLVSAIRS